MLVSAILTTAGHLAKLSGSMSIDDNVIPSCMGYSNFSLLVVANVFLDDMMDIKRNFPTIC